MALPRSSTGARRVRRQDAIVLQPCQFYWPASPVMEVTWYFWLHVRVSLLESGRFYLDDSRLTFNFQLYIVSPPSPGSSLLLQLKAYEKCGTLPVRTKFRQNVPLSRSVGWTSDAFHNWQRTIYRRYPALGGWQDIQPWGQSLCPKLRVQNIHLQSRESLAPWDHWQQRKFVDWVRRDWCAGAAWYLPNLSSLFNIVPQAY